MIRETKKRILNGKTTFMVVVLAIVAVFQACGIPLNFLNGDKYDGRMYNGQGYGGMRSLDTVAVASYKPTRSDEMTPSATYYRFVPGFTCESGGVTNFSHAGLIWFQDQQIHLRENQCAAASSVITGIEIPSYNRDLLGYGPSVFELRTQAPDPTANELHPYIWCRTGGSNIVGTDVVIRRQAVASEVRTDEDLSLDFRRGSLDPRIQFSRSDNGAAIASYFDSAGVLRRAAAGAPRFDHDPGTKRPLGLLIEESRTNILLKSEKFDQATWQVIGTGASVQGDQAVAPDSANSADRLVWTAGASGVLAQTITGSVVTGKPYSFSLWARSSSGSGRIRLGIADAASGQQWSTSDMELGAEWRRFVFTGTFSSASDAQILIGNASAAASEALVWGGQLELGNVPTSYIATDGSPVSRGADTVTMADLSWLTQGQGTFLADFSIPYLDDGAQMSVFGLRGSSTDRLTFYRSPNNSRYFWVSVETGGVLQYTQSDALARIQAGIPSRAVLAYADGVFRSAINGVSRSSTKGAVFKNATALLLGQWNGNQYHLNGHLSGLKYWKTVKSETDVRELSYPLGDFVGQVIIGQRTDNDSDPYLKRQTAPFRLIQTPGVPKLGLHSEEYQFQLALEPRSPGQDKVAGALNALVDGQAATFAVECRIEDSH